MAVNIPITYVLVVCQGKLPLGKQFRPVPGGPTCLPVAEVLPDAKSQPRYLSLNAAAELVSVSRSTLQRAIRARQLVAVKLGRRTVVCLHDLLGFMDHLHRVGTDPLTGGGANEA